MSVTIVFCNRTYSEAEMWMGEADAHALTLSAHLPGLVSQSYLCIFTLCLPQKCIYNGFPIKKDKHLQWFSSKQSVSLLIPWVRDTPWIKHVESIHTRFSGILGSLSYQLKSSTSFWAEASRNQRETLALQLCPTNQLCNLMLRENCCPQEKHTFLSWYRLLLYLVTFSSTK